MLLTIQCDAIDYTILLLTIIRYPGETAIIEFELFSLSEDPAETVTSGLLIAKITDKGGRRRQYNRIITVSP